MKCLSKVLFTALSVAALGGTAVAQEPPAGEEGTGEMGAEVGGEAGATTEGEATMPPAEPPAVETAAAPGSLTLGAGKILIAGQTLNINMSADAVGKPISLAPNIWYGVNEKLTLGLTHDLGTTTWTPRPFPGLGICLSGEENGCGKVYDNVGIDALYAISSGKTSLAAHPGLVVQSFDPFTMSLRLGLLGRYAANDKISIVFDPAVFVGLNERDAGNKEVLDIPVWLWFNVNPQLGVYAHTGIRGMLDGFGDTYIIPVGVGATYKVNEQLGIGGDFHFLNLAGEGSSADFRALSLRVEYAL